ncbi:MAG: hypothetical protein K9J85_04525 [Desulfobacteraceae bacterium]|nr:hypothetical protein [Desulfobacteraceae bacterium]
MPSHNTAELKLTVPKKMISFMRLLISRGIRLETRPGISVKEFLKTVLPADENYLENSIQTIFMNGHAVDDPVQTLITGPCTIALSAAMPGVFGAAFRKKGIYSGMRAGYLQNSSGDENNFNGETVPVTLKCFNQVAEDLGNTLLENGVTMDIKDFENFWKPEKNVLENRALRAEINGSPADDVSEVAGLFEQKTTMVKIRVVAEG